MLQVSRKCEALYKINWKKELLYRKMIWSPSGYNSTKILFLIGANSLFFESLEATFRRGKSADAGPGSARMSEGFNKFSNCVNAVLTPSPDYGPNSTDETQDISYLEIEGEEYEDREEGLQDNIEEEYVLENYEETSE